MPKIAILLDPVKLQHNAKEPIAVLLTPKTILFKANLPIAVFPKFGRGPDNKVEPVTLNDPDNDISYSFIPVNASIDWVT
mgnify:CR=1 FL=1